MSRLGPCRARISGDRQTDRHTHTQTHKPSTVTLAAHARRGLIIVGLEPRRKVQSSLHFFITDIVTITSDLCTSWRSELYYGLHQEVFLLFSIAPSRHWATASAGSSFLPGRITSAQFLTANALTCRMWANLCSCQSSSTSRLPRDRSGVQQGDGLLPTGAHAPRNFQGRYYPYVLD